MVITFPHLGNTYLAVKCFFEELGIRCVIPASNCKATLQKGAFLSPDEMCLPFKLMMGNYIDSIARGADTILITGSCGPCRFGEYCELQMKLLQKNGYDVRFIVIDSPYEIGRHAFFERIARVTQTSDAGKIKKLHCLKRAVALLGLIDSIDASAYGMAGYEAHSGSFQKLLVQCKEAALLCHGIDETRRTLLHYKDKLNRLQTDNKKKPLKIALIGEIYTMIEPFSNLHIEQKLMDLGVCSKRLLTPSWWVRDLILKPIGLNSPLISTAAKKYLPHEVGGHAKESIAHIVRSQMAGYDGAIQVFPMGCMPEIVTKAVLPKVQRDLRFPVMTLIVDEITGEAGYCTRIEAFLDMLESKRKKGLMYA